MRLQSTTRSPLAWRVLPSLLLLCSALAGEVYAQSDDPAQAHYKTGQAYYQRGAYAEAIGEFERAFKLSRRPELLYNIGQAYERLGEIRRAVDYFERYLAAAGDGKDEALAQKIDNLKRRLGQTGLRIHTTVAGATVTVDGKPAGTTPLAAPLPVAPGQRKVTVAKAGYAPFSVVVSVLAGSVVSIDAELQAVSARAAGAAGGAVAAASSRPGAVADQPVVRPAPGRRRLWTWVALGGAGAMLAAAAITGPVALGKASDARTASDDDATTAKSVAVVTDVLLGLGVAAAVTGTVLFFLEGRRGGEQRAGGSATLVLPALGPGYAGASASVRF